MHRNSHLTYLHVEQRPGLVVDRGIDLAKCLELVGSLEHVSDFHAGSTGNVLHVKTFVDLGCVLHALVDLAGVTRDTGRESTATAASVAAI